ncbi:DUF4254 domain-containing protein [Massilia glaciei]|uniref:DUF4254 domain-containing protein n=1 Tax=Massilia glaciei TaxID=1524097 RepID=A0A2U2HHL8_9BURK|nr:DUF4254 domain-containing protein [Massilia glaciei]PWF45398.1 DUF4254 domain-containing protein [Massilia glaciei]
MLTGLHARAIAQLHDSMLSDSDTPSARDDALAEAWHFIEANHFFNCRLWREEDKARRTDVDASEIVASKRLIDQYNQKRNDAIEALDEALLAGLSTVRCVPHARLHSETAGAMIDRLSILSLKVFHMREQTRRFDVSEAHLESCANKLQRLSHQREDLGNCFDELLADASYGHVYYKVYRQFKMYNDPTLNPYLYAGLAQGAHGKGAP